MCQTGFGRVCSVFFRGCRDGRAASRWPQRMGLFASLLILFGGQLAGQQKLPFQDPDLPLEQRLDDLLSRMTPAEKISQMVYNAPAIQRLGIPAYNWWNECLHGVGRAGLATVFPQAIGLAATWDPQFMQQVATVISDEARAKHHEFLRRGMHGIYQGLTFWTPNINIFRDPRWGRGQETYGEDPYLTGTMAVSFIRGLQGNDDKYLKVVATAKHFAVHSGPETSRHSFDAVTSVRDLRTTYLAAFEATVKQAGVESIMCAYNRYEGEPCCGSSLLLDQILRQGWGFDGYVVSDCGAVSDIYEGHKIVRTPAEAAALAVQAGTDLNCGSTYASLGKALQQELIDEAALDRAVRRLFEVRFRLGMFDPPERVPYARIPYDVNNSPQHKKMALEAARKAVVLLKNDGNQLPLRKDLDSIAVIGPNADDPFVLLGNYNGTPERSVTALEGIRRKVGSNTKVYYARGCDIAPNVPPVVPIPSEFLFPADGDARDRGLTGAYYAGDSFDGQPAFTRIDPVLDFIWRNTTPVSGALADTFSVRWEGSLRAPESGAFQIGANGLSAYKVFLDGKELVSFNGVHEPDQKVKEVELEGGRFYSLRIEYRNHGADPQLQLVWSRPGAEEMETAFEIAEKSDAIIFVGGLSPQLEGEEMPVKVEGFVGGDRTEIRLPRTQESLLKQLVATEKPVILLLLNGSALATVWEDENIPAILTAWYPGQSGGDAIADVLFGDYNPAGRLPVTWYRSLEDLPPFDQYDMAGRTYRYFSGGPLYPFGHGLSYTRFEYENLKVSPGRLSDGGPAAVTVEVRNAGSVRGEEVVQAYVTDRDASVPVPLRSLAGFERIMLAPGESRTVSLELAPEAFALIDTTGKRVIESGDFLISVGGKQPGFEGSADAPTTEVVSAELAVTAPAPVAVP